MTPAVDGKTYWVVTMIALAPGGLNNYSSKIVFDIGLQFPQKHSACSICSLDASLSQPGGQALLFTLH